MPEPAVGAERKQFATRELPVEQDLQEDLGRVTAFAESRAGIPADAGDDAFDLGAVERRGALGGFSAINAAVIVSGDVPLRCSVPARLVRCVFR